MSTSRNLLVRSKNLLETGEKESIYRLRIKFMQSPIKSGSSLTFRRQSYAFFLYRSVWYSTCGSLLISRSKFMLPTQPRNVSYLLDCAKVKINPRFGRTGEFD